MVIVTPVQGFILIFLVRNKVFEFDIRGQRMGTGDNCWHCIFFYVLGGVKTVHHIFGTWNFVYDQFCCMCLFIYFHILVIKFFFFYKCVTFLCCMLQSSVRCYKGRTLVCNGKLENMDPAIGGERTTLVDSCESEKVRAVRINTPKVGCNQNNENEFPVIAQNEALDIEEGQVASNGDRVVEGYRRMLETKAKMEKRWERFKEPISLNKEPDKLSNPDIDLLVETAEEQQHRPARKRRWGIQRGKHSMSFSLIQ